MMLRPYRPEDKEQLVEIFRLHVPAYFAAPEQQDLEAYLETSGDTYFVLEEEGRIAGGGGYHFGDGKTLGRISWYLFHPDHRHKGLGSWVVRHCLYVLRAEPGIKKLEVWTSQLAYAFYGRFGFTTEEIRKDFWAQGHDLYRMTMKP